MPLASTTAPLRSIGVGTDDQDGASNHGGSRRDSAGSIPQFSLARPNPQHYESPYVEPAYRQMNPQYGRMSDYEPVWSLAQPLPHVVRPGMHRGVLPEDRKKSGKYPEAGTSERRTEEEAADAQEGTTEIQEGEELPAEDEKGFFNTWCKIRFYLREPLGE